MPDLSELHLHWIDILIVVGYLCLLPIVGAYHSRRQRTLTDFFLAGQEMRWAVVGMSLLAALNSGIDYLMQPSSMVKFGACILVINLTWLLLLPYVCLVTVPLYRRLGAISAYEYLERRFDVRVRMLAATIFMLWRMGWMAIALYVPALVISTATGGRISIAAMTIALGLIITSYTMLGGIRAVIWNDVIQYCVMFTGLAATVGLVIYRVDGGFMTILAQLTKVGEPAGLTAPAGAPEGFLSYFYIPMTAGGLFLAILVARLGSYTSDQVMVQRIQTARSLADARRGFFVTAFSDTVWMVALGFVGLALFAYFSSQEGGLPTWVKTHPDQIFPYFIAHDFPIGLTGLVIAAILAASISSIDSALNSLTTTTMIDFVERLYFGRRQSANQDGGNLPQNKHLVFYSRFTTVVLAILGIALSLQVRHLGSLLEVTSKIVNSFAGPMLGIYLLGMFTERATSVGVLIGGAVGAIVTIFVAFQSEITGAINACFNTEFNTTVVLSFLWPGALGLLTTLVIGYSTSLLASSADRSRNREWMWANVTRKDL